MVRVCLMAVTCAALASIAAAQSPAPPSPAAPAASQAAASPSPVPPPYTPSSPDPSRGAELLKKAVAAHGGAAAIDAIQRVELRGFSGRTMPGQDPIEMASHTHMVIPGLYRNELTTQAGPIATLLNRDGAFVLLSGGALPLPEAEATALRATANRNLMVLLRTRDPKELRVARVGSARLPDGEVEMVEFEMSGQKTVLGDRPEDGAGPAGHLHDADGGRHGPGRGHVFGLPPALQRRSSTPSSRRGRWTASRSSRPGWRQVVVNGAIDESLFALPSPPPAPAEPLPWASPSPSGR